MVTTGSSSYSASAATTRRVERQRAMARRSAIAAAAASAAPLDESLMCMIGDDARVPPHNLVDAVTLTECLHFFCRRCLLKRLRRDRHCPKCHQDLSADYSGDDALQRLVYRATPDHFWRQMRLYWRRRGRGVSADECRRMREMAERLCADDERVSLALDYVPMRRVLHAEHVDDTAAASTVVAHSTAAPPSPLLAEFTDDDEEYSKPPEIGVSAPGKAPQEHAPTAASSTPSAKMPSESLLFRRYFRCAASTHVGTLRKLLERKLAAAAGRHVVYIVEEIDAKGGAILADNVTLRELIYASGWRRDAPFRVAFTLAQCVVAEEDDDDGEKPPVLDAEEALPQHTASAASITSMSSPSTSTVSSTLPPATKAVKNASAVADAVERSSAATTDDVDLARHWRPNVPRLSIQASALDPACRTSNGAMPSIITATAAPTTASTTSMARTSLNEAAKRRRKSAPVAKAENGTASPSRRPSKPGKVRKLVVDGVKSDVKHSASGAETTAKPLEAVSFASLKDASVSVNGMATTTVNIVASTTATTTTTITTTTVATTTNNTTTTTTSGSDGVQQLKQQNSPPKIASVGAGSGAATAAKVAAVVNTGNTQTTVVTVTSTKPTAPLPTTINATTSSLSSSVGASSSTTTSTPVPKAPAFADNGPTLGGPMKAVSKADKSAQSDAKSSGGGRKSSSSTTTAMMTATTSAVPKSTPTSSRVTAPKMAKNNNINNNNNNNNLNNNSAEIFNPFAHFGPPAGNNGMLGGLPRSGVLSAANGIPPSGTSPPNNNMAMFQQFYESMAYIHAATFGKNATAGSSPPSALLPSPPVASEGGSSFYAAAMPYFAAMCQQQTANNTSSLLSPQTTTTTITTTATTNSKRKPSAAAAGGSAPKRPSPPKPRHHHQLPTMVLPPPTTMVYGSHAASRHQPPPPTTAYDFAGAARLSMQTTLLNAAAAAAVVAASGGANKASAVVSNAT